MTSCTGIWKACVVYFVIRGFVIGLGSDCTPNVNIPKDSKVSQSKDQSLSLRCPVSLCSQELPNVIWCRTETDGQCEFVKLDHRISSGWENRTEDEATHVLRFHILQINDTGFYKCSVTYNGWQMIGSVIEVTFSELGSDCTPNIIKQNSKVSQSKDQSLSLRCPISLCSQELPKVTWCRTEIDGQCETVKLDHWISSGWENRTEDEATHVLRFHILKISDTGFYKCSVIYKGLQIVGSVIEVTFSEIITQPSVSLELNDAGFPECRAVGYGPSPNISWIPYSDNIKTTTNHNPDQTWTVISTYPINDVNGTAVICMVSHHTFAEPWTWPIALAKCNTYVKHNTSGVVWLLAAFIVFVVIVLGLFVYMKVKIQDEDDKDCTSVSSKAE